MSCSRDSLRYREDAALFLQQAETAPEYRERERVAVPDERSHQGMPEWIWHLIVYALAAAATAVVFLWLY